MKKTNVLVAPLNWGLGHAARVIPIIDNLIKNNFSVLIAADGDALNYLKHEFPHLQCIKLHDIKIKYAKKNLFLKILIQSPKIIYKAIVEHFLLHQLIKKHPVDLVISDNRFGLWNKHTYNIFITHQLKLMFPPKLTFLSPVYQIFLKNVINKYDECWVPDFPNHYLSGELSCPDNIPPKTKFIGPLSRFKRYNQNKKVEKKHDLLFILSGPEPQRTIFENIIFEQIKNKSLNIALVRGLKKKSDLTSPAETFGIVHSEQLFRLIQQSELIICRSGYSSIMDLIITKKKAILVPTPGQTEQEYLARHLQSQKQFYFVSQQNFNLNQALSDIQFLTENNLEFDDNLLDKEINRLRLLMK